MSEQEQAREIGRRGVSPLTIAAAVLVVVLALGALLWPRNGERHQAHTLLVYDASGDQVRVTGLFNDLCTYLATLTDGSLKLVVVRTTGEFRTQLDSSPDFVLAPDGLALQVPVKQYLPLVVGRRPAPQNLRPRGVLVYRHAAGDMPEPWRNRTRATVFGDSLALTAVGVLRAAGDRVWPDGCAFGPDPYDHGPVLHAMRLGGFDYAVVRQWDAARFFESGLLPRDEFAVRELVEPVPDMVLMVSREVPRHLRLRSGEGLSGLGRQMADETPQERKLRLALADVYLVGFNVLLEPDFELVRKNYPGDWLPGTD